MIHTFAERNGCPEPRFERKISEISLASEIIGLPFRTLFHHQYKATDMKENWVKIYSSSDLMRVKVAEDVLKQRGIVSHIESRPDSAMPMLGEAVLYTLPENEEAAKKVLHENGFE